MSETYKEPTHTTHTIVVHVPRDWPEFLGALLINLALWGALFLLSKYNESKTEEAKTPLAVRTISPEQLEALHRQAYTRNQRVVVQSDDAPQKSIADPFPAEFLSDKTRRVQKQTILPGEDPKGTLADPAKAEQQSRKIVEKLFASGQQIPLLSEPIDAPKEGKQSDEKKVAKNQSSHSRRLSMDDLGHNVEMGAGTMLNTDEYRFYGFVNRIKESVYPIWRRNLDYYSTRAHVSSGDYVVQGVLVLSPDGSFVRIEEWAPCGINAFDRSVEEAFRDLPRVPNPPKEMADQDGMLRLKFSFRVDNSDQHLFVDYRHAPDDDVPASAR